jgi:hypothetical protein
MANRRKFITGLGALAAGSAAAVGTGAFTSVEADRTVNVAVADDASAFLSLDDIDSSPNSEYVDVSGEQVILNLDSTNSGGSGFNAGAETRIDDLIRVANQGTQTINVWVTLDAESGDTFNDDTLYFYPGDATDTALNDGEGDGDGDNVLGLTPGESANLGVLVDLGDVSTASETPTATFHANVDEGDSSPVDESGGSFAVVAEDGSGDFSDLQTAIDNATGSTIAVKDTGNPLNVSGPLAIGEDGLTIRGFESKPTLNYTGGYPSGVAVDSTGANVTLENLRFKFNGNVSDDSLANFSGGNSFFSISGDGTTLRNIDMIADRSDLEAPVSFTNNTASDVTIENSLFDIVDANGDSIPAGAGSGQSFVGARFLRNNTFRGGTRIHTVGEASTIKNNTVENPASTEYVAINGDATNVLVEGNSIEYDPSNLGNDFGDDTTIFNSRGAEFRVEPNAEDLRVNGQDFTSGEEEELAEVLSKANSGQLTESGDATVVVRSTNPNTYFPEKFTIPA